MSQKLLVEMTAFVPGTIISHDFLQNICTEMGAELSLPKCYELRVIESRDALKSIHEDDVKGIMTERFMSFNFADETEDKPDTETHLWRLVEELPDDECLLWFGVESNSKCDDSLALLRYNFILHEPVIVAELGATKSDLRLRRIYSLIDQQLDLDANAAAAAHLLADPGGHKRQEGVSSSSSSSSTSIPPSTATVKILGASAMSLAMMVLALVGITWAHKSNTEASSSDERYDSTNADPLKLDKNAFNDITS